MCFSLACVLPLDALLLDLLRNYVFFFFTRFKKNKTKNNKKKKTGLLCHHVDMFGITLGFLWQH